MLQTHHRRPAGPAPASAAASATLARSARRQLPAPRSARQAVTQFVASGLVALLVVLLGGWYAGRHAAEREAIEFAGQRTTTLAHAVVEPELTDALVDGDAAALRRFDEVVRRRVLSSDVLRVKLWRPDGRIAYSDEPALIGAHFPLEPSEKRALRTGQLAAEVSDLNRPENRYEQVDEAVMEVYLRVRTPGGRTLLFETYQSRNTVATREREIWRQFAPITLGGLVLLLGLLVPLALSLTRRLEQARAERERLLRHALDASQLERRRIAAHLHDGIVQSLAGSSYALAGIADNLAGQRQRQASSVVRSAAAELRQGVRGLRSLLVEIYPPSLRRSGLSAALSDLTAQLSSREIDVVLDLAEPATLPPETETTLFRVAQEAVRNIVKHAAASTVHVTLVCDRSHVRLTVRDDGCGFAIPGPRTTAASAEKGHVGLMLLTDLVAEVGGTLTIDAAPGHGTSVTATVPLP